MASSGKFDRIVYLERAASTVNESGEQVLSWSPWLKRWAEYRPLQGSERFAGQQLVARNLIEFRVRYDAQVATVTPTQTFRLVCESRTYDVTDVQPSVRRRETITLLCTARAE